MVALLRWMALGKRLDYAVRRGRKLHRWQGYSMQMAALRAEVRELAQELYTMPVDARRQRERIRAEALDVAVVALRIYDGR